MFLIKDGVLYTPDISENALKGITSKTIIQCAQHLNIPFEYKSIIRDELFLADELFFTGTAAEVTPIKEIDGITIGNGTRGPITEKLQTLFFDIVSGRKSINQHWLTYI